jgi:hypothetical protein
MDSEALLERTSALWESQFLRRDPASACIPRASTEVYLPTVQAVTDDSDNAIGSRFPGPMKYRYPVTSCSCPAAATLNPILAERPGRDASKVGTRRP